MMPGMDGIETTRKIRELEESRRNAGGKFQDIPIICLSAGDVKGMEGLCLLSGMNGFIPRPIEFAVLNETLRKFLPEEKYTFAGPEGGISVVGNLNPQKEKILGELADIEGLDVAQGLHYSADNPETYASTLKKLSAGLEKGLILIRKSLAAGDWKTYAVQMYAYKGLCAAAGVQALAVWGQELEEASKSRDKSACLVETEAFCSALEDFNRGLHRTSLFAEKTGTDKIEIGAADMAAKLTELAEACDEGRSTRIKAVVQELESLRLAGGPPDFEAALPEIFSLARSLDYDEAAEKARDLCVRLGS
jgi:HPt (histidine-containing phosphotransfer) domain-containing protein